MIWPVAALADTPLAFVEGDSGENSDWTGDAERPRALPPPPTDAFPLDAHDIPDVRFEQMPVAPVTGGPPISTGEIWESPGRSPHHSWFLARQPLRQRLRELYGPPEGRHRGLGQPLTSESWLYRPFSAGWFMGGIIGTPLIDEWLGAGSGYSTGFRFGWDQNYYWGLEMQFTYGELGLWDSALAKEDRRQWYIREGWDEQDPAFDRLLAARRSLGLYQWAVSALHFPWGDARWRPYVSAGIGAAQMKFTDIFLVDYKETFFVLPLAIGVKYHWNDRVALRVECSDSISVPGGGLMVVNNFSVNGALEIRFGGARTAYWPWNPGRSFW